MIVLDQRAALRFQGLQCQYGEDYQDTGYGPDALLECSQENHQCIEFHSAGEHQRFGLNVLQCQVELFGAY